VQRRQAELTAYYNCDSSTIRARHATTRYEVFRALAYEIDSSTPRETVVGVSCMLIDSFSVDVNNSATPNLICRCCEPLN